MVVTKWMGAAIVGCLIASTHALAQDAGFYIGGGVGITKTELDTTGLVGSADEKDTGWKIFGGYQFNKNIAIEAGYADLGKASFTGTLAAPAGPFPAGSALTAEFESTAIFASVVGTLPISNQFSVFGKLGIARAETDFNASLAGFFGTLSDETTEATYGLGVRFNATRNVAVRAEWDRFRVGGANFGGKEDVDMFSVNLIFNF